MATHLDLEEQEQLDQLKHFWKQYGNLITWVLIAVLGAFAAWNGWNWWQREQAVKAGALFDEVDKAAQAGEADRAATLFATLKERFPRTAFTQQAALLLAKAQFDKGQADNARATLSWVADNAAEDEYKTIARLRLAGVLLDQKKYDEALKQLDGATAREFEALVADRRGDILMAQGKKDEARSTYQKAWQAMDAKVDYRRLVEAKLTALGAPPEADKAKPAEASK
ncbi:tetratricopeptide repeat protein [Piscinibacter sp. XHJ-5]|uniref:YfgM family protein n=1 Tax=Piscinibacter sp. XHJ-5 TaxID=3037797 RepID=UPI0024530DDA|nr:tetratricopeptide repeat protein [Piscinibacter sp. XHJ-5]